MATSKQSPQNTERPLRILSASVDTRLNYTRALLLRHHGFFVTTSESLEHAREQIQRQPFDVLVFGSTLTADVCWQLAEIFRKHNPKGKIIEILPIPFATPKNRPDATVVSGDEPTNLIASIRVTYEG